MIANLHGKLIDKNPSAIDEKIIAFRDLIKEVDME